MKALNPILFRLGTVALLGLLCGCAGGRAGRPGEELGRRGDEIVACGRFFHVGTRVVLWLDPGGYDGYRVERRFGEMAESDWGAAAGGRGVLESPNRYGLRKEGLTAAELERVRGGGWDLPLLQREVDQFVLHYDACGTSRRCFEVLHDHRGLSVHFLLDVDGTIYQTLDLKERAWHATVSNTRSIGVEIAQAGAVPASQAGRLMEWYEPEAGGRMRLRFPPGFGETGIRRQGFVGRPSRPGLVSGRIQGRELVQYDFTEEQYAALEKLTAALCRMFPRLACEAPRREGGGVEADCLSGERLREFQGVLGHYHIQTNKVDPGPAFQWERVLGGARRELGRGGW